MVDEGADAGSGADSSAVAPQFTDHMVLNSVLRFPPLGQRVLLEPNSGGCDLGKWVSMYKDHHCAWHVARGPLQHCQ